MAACAGPDPAPSQRGNAMVSCSASNRQTVLAESALDMQGGDQQARGGWRLNWDGPQNPFFMECHNIGPSQRLIRRRPHRGESVMRSAKSGSISSATILQRPTSSSITCALRPLLRVSQRGSTGQVPDGKFIQGATKSEPPCGPWRSINRPTGSTAPARRAAEGDTGAPDERVGSPLLDVNQVAPAWSLARDPTRLT
jgi:hypothetical protein